MTNIISLSDYRPVADTAPSEMPFAAQAVSLPSERAWFLNPFALLEVEALEQAARDGLMPGGIDDLPIFIGIDWSSS